MDPSTNPHIAAASGDTCGVWLTSLPADAGCHSWIEDLQDHAAGCNATGPETQNVKKSVRVRLPKRKAMAASHQRLV